MGGEKGKVMREEKKTWKKRFEKKDSQPSGIRHSLESCCGSNLETLVSLVNPEKQEEERVKNEEEIVKKKKRMLVKSHYGLIKADDGVVAEVERMQL